MLASAIRELATTQTSPLIAAAFFERTVQIWDVSSQTTISEFSTLFCAGARNLALSPSGESLVAGLSRSTGKVAAYDVLSGRKLWEKTLIYPSALRFDPTGRSVLCTRNGRSVLRLDPRTGGILEVIEGTIRQIEDPSGDVLRVLGQRGNSIIQLMGSGHTLSLDAGGLSVLDVQFSPNSVCLSQARGKVRCISRVDGRLIWTFDPGATGHVLRLHYSAALNAFFGILRNFEEGGGRSLMKFDPVDGSVERVCEFDSWDEVFLGPIDRFVTSAGEIRNLSDGTVVGRLAFPQTEYHPDA